MNALEFIYHLQTIEEYSFSWKELVAISDKTEISLRRELSRLVEKNKIINLRREFYLIIPPRYSKFGQIPIQLYIHKLFKFLEKEYYLSFYSAAKFYGASHQQVQQEYVMINYPKISDIKRNNISVRFITSTKWPKANIVEMKSDAGIFKISSPSLTAINLIKHQNKVGGINRLLAVVEELIEEMSINDISKLVHWYSHLSSLQRFGFLLEELGAKKEILTIIEEKLKSDKYYPTLLIPTSNQKAGKVKNRWKVVVNTTLENDL